MSQSKLWVFATFRAPSSGFQDLLTEKRKSAPAIHGTFDVSELVDGSLPLAHYCKEGSKPPEGLDPLSSPPSLTSGKRQFWQSFGERLSGAVEIFTAEVSNL